jgi:hypothetical protein
MTLPRGKGAAALPAPTAAILPYPELPEMSRSGSEPAKLDSSTLHYVIERIDHDLRALDRLVGRCALCRDAELVRLLGELRVMERQARLR